MPAVMQFELKGRYKRQYLNFDGKSSRDFLLYLSGPGVYDSPSADVEVVTIPGRNGDLIVENAKPGQRRFTNIDITYEAFFFNGIPAKTQAVKSWLLSPSGYRRLQDTYNPEFFRMAVCKDAIEFEVKRQKTATMELKFHCRPQRWSVEGLKTEKFSSFGYIRNPFAFASQPLIRVYGKKEGRLYVGENALTIYRFTDGYVDLNSETHNAYNKSGFCNGDILSDDFPELPPGLTQVAWEGGITGVEITPRWWTL